MLADGTKDWTNYKVDIKLHLNGFQVSRIEIVPSVSQMILRASTFVPPGNLNGPLRKKSYALERRDPAHRQRKFKHDADIGIDAVFSIAKQQRLWGRSTAITYSGTVKEVLGSCHSLGVTVDGYSALSIQRCIPGQRPTSQRRNRRKRGHNTNNNTKDKPLETNDPRGKKWDYPKREREKNAGEKEEEEKKSDMECPIPNEDDVLQFIRKDGSVEDSLCRTTFMTPFEIEERRALSKRKRAEATGENN